MRSSMPPTRHSRSRSRTTMPGSTSVRPGADGLAKGLIAQSPIVAWQRFGRSRRTATGLTGIFRRASSPPSSARIPVPSGSTSPDPAQAALYRLSRGLFAGGRRIRSAIDRVRNVPPVYGSVTGMSTSRSATLISRSPDRRVRAEFFRPRTPLHTDTPLVERCRPAALRRVGA